MGVSVSEQAVRYAAIYRDRELARRAGLTKLVASLQARMPAAAAVLRSDFGASRVGVFGSLVAGRFDESSDVDIYVDSVAPGRFFEAVDRLCVLFGRPVDLIELRAASESLRARIAAEGVDVD